MGKDTKTDSTQHSADWKPSTHRDKLSHADLLDKFGRVALAVRQDFRSHNRTVRQRGLDNITKVAFTKDLRIGRHNNKYRDNETDGRAD